MKTKYAFTVKKLRSPYGAKKEDYNKFFDHLTRYVHIENKYYEITNNILHYHGIINIDNDLYRKRLITRGYHLYMTKIRDEQNWIRYCTKRKETYSDELLREKGLLIKLLKNIKVKQIKKGILIKKNATKKIS